MLVQRVSKIAYRLEKLHTKFGDPRRVPVVLVTSTGQTLIEPNPEVVRVTPQQLQQFNTAAIQVKPTDWQVREIPRTYSAELLTRCRYLINAVMGADGRYSGEPAEFRYLDDRDLVFYTVIIAGHLRR